MSGARTIMFGAGALALGGAAFAPAVALAFDARCAVGLAGALAVSLALIPSVLRNDVSLTLRRRRPRSPIDTYIYADDVGLTRVARATSTRLVTWSEPFGMTLFASYGRVTALLAFTTPTHTRYVPVRIDAPSAADDEILARIAVLADLDLLDGVAHEDALSTSAVAALVRHVESRNARAPGRVFLSDTRGASITLDRATLAVGHRTFDLTSELAWRPLMFHESTGQGAALYQATWIRQATNELVLVAPMPASIVPRAETCPRAASGQLGRTLTRDLLLLEAPADAPPSRDLRLAIDRPFMMAVRQRLGAAPLARLAVADPPHKPEADRHETLP